MSSDGDDLTGSRSPDKPHSWRIEAPFGTGIKRKRVEFVPAASEVEVQETARDIDPSRGSSVAEFYLSLVLPSGSGPANASRSSKSTPSNQETSEHISCGSSSVTEVSTRRTTRSMMPSRRDHATNATLSSEGISIHAKLSDSLDTSDEERRGEAGNDDPASYLSEDTDVQPGSAVVEHSIETSAAVDEICSACKARVTDWKSHVRTTAHMVSEEHSKPPHHLNRQSEGYKHMVKLGWDPDNGEGLGAGGQGIRFPVKAILKKDNLGIGARPSKSIRDNAGNVSDTDVKKQRLLTAKEMQYLEKAERTARQDLHDYLRH
ncbi:hypothetical protein ABW20_dc0107801 [Dactylellina cionopaga]|nr:hypothetical protein ABW20_dc0107801 [Dactylellina cionopaga]